MNTRKLKTPATPSQRRQHVNRPPHYNTAEIETIDAMGCDRDGYHYHLQGTILKYLHRYRHKGDPRTDLQGALVFDRLIEEYNTFRNQFAEDIFNLKYRHEGCETWAALSYTGP